MAIRTQTTAQIDSLATGRSLITSSADSRPCYVRGGTTATGVIVLPGCIRLALDTRLTIEEESILMDLYEVIERRVLRELSEGLQ